MFENCLNTKKQGNIGLGYAIAWFIHNNYTVSIPINDSQDYDLVVEKDCILNTVQVKTSTQLSDSGGYKVELRSTGGNSGRVLRKFDEYNVELLFILCENGDKYLIPRKDITATNSIVVGNKYIEYKV